MPGYPDWQRTARQPTDLVLLSPANPGANNWSVNVTAKQRWRLVAVSFLLSTDATAGNRTMQLSFYRSGSLYLTIEGPSVQGPSLGRQWSFVAGLGSAYAGGLTNPSYFVGVGEHVLNAGDSIQLSTAGGVAGDRLTGIRLAYERLV